MRGGEVCAGWREGLGCGGGTTSGMHGEGPIQGLWGPRARAERTANMVCMVVTLEVSKLSGWLNANAYCRVEGRACDAGGRGASREAGGPVMCSEFRVYSSKTTASGGTTSGKHGEGPIQGLWGPRARAERTANM